jgi:hypothetical protein
MKSKRNTHRAVSKTYIVETSVANSTIVVLADDFVQVELPTLDKNTMATHLKELSVIVTDLD